MTSTVVEPAIYHMNDQNVGKAIHQYSSNNLILDYITRVHVNHLTLCARWQTGDWPLTFKSIEEFVQNLSPLDK